MSEYCCERFKSFYTKHDLVHFNKAFYYIMLWTDMGTEVYALKVCPFCGTVINPSGETKQDDESDKV